MSEATILVGDVRQRLSDIADSSVQCCVTSPPYWGLRDYGTGSWDGGDANCDHQGKPMATKANINRNCGTGNDVKNATAREFYKDVCGKCGAIRIDSQIGLEQTPDEYVAEMVSVFAEVRRVLRDDGTLWLNLGDSYVGYKGDNYLKNKTTSNLQLKSKVPLSHNIGTPQTSGLKSKDLVGIPWRVAFALQADGWYLRQDIIWHKPNPMPESVTDRCTKSHEYLFLLTKSAKYYFDNRAIAEPAKYAGDDRGARGDTRRGTSMNSMSSATGETRNKRDVWTIATKPFRGAHFAVMPEALVEPCILASSKPDDLVLDPFTGSGTVAVVALKHGRNFVGVELNPEYAEIAKNRIESSQPMFNEVNVDFHTPLV
jgi:DNA modification methylase